MNRILAQSLSRSAPVVSRSTPMATAGPLSAGAMRFLNLHEYQSKDLMEKFNVQVQKGKMAESATAAGEVAKWIKTENPKAELILKAQIHAGGRGKGHFDNGFKGGVKICEEPEEVAKFAEKMLGAKLVTKQTGPEGQLCSKVLVNEGITIDRELYFAIILDRSYHSGAVIVASTRGGMDIEEVAESDPDAIVKRNVDIIERLSRADAESLAKDLGFEGDLVGKAADQFLALVDLFFGTDATQVEINPLAVGGVPGGAQNVVFAVDAKLNFDDNATFRQREIFDLRDKSMEDPRDVAAEEAGLNYIGLDGNIGCMVNGAGLAMATMDIIKLHGGSPANFLDVGGGATAAQVTQAFELLTSDKNVQAILVNIFGGIMKCDTIAEGIVQAAKNVGLKVPLVVRLEGTNVEMGKKILQESGIECTTADDLDDAAVKAVAAV